jgi:biopolymer transport protein TolR
MGMSTGGGGGSMSEINVTPLVDVMLVLLIIFMVTTPMMSQGIPVQLPQSTQQQNVEMNMDDSTILTITKDGTVYLDDRPIPADRLEFQLRRLYGELAVRNIFLRGDRRVPYGEVVRVLDMMKRVGLSRVGMVTELYEGP